MSEQASPSTLRVRLAVLASLVVLVPVGLATKGDSAHGTWVEAHLGGALYVTFFCLASTLVWPKARSWLITLIVLGATCCVELLQLWHPPWLDAIRDTRPGGMILGYTFTWADFPWYGLGALLGWGWAWLLRRLLPKGRADR